MVTSLAPLTAVRVTHRDAVAIAVVLMDCTTTTHTGFLNPRAQRPKGEDVFNGIAWDASTNTLYLTGKLWNNLYKLRLHGDALDPPLRH